MSPSLFGLKVLGQSVTTGKLWQQQWEGTGHAESTVKKQKPGTLLLISLPPVNPAQEPSTGPGASHFRGGSSHLSQHSHSQLHPSDTGPAATHHRPHLTVVMTSTLMETSWYGSDGSGRNGFWRRI